MEGPWNMKSKLLSKCLGFRALGKRIVKGEGNWKMKLQLGLHRT